MASCRASARRCCTGWRGWRCASPCGCISPSAADGARLRRRSRCSGGAVVLNPQSASRSSSGARRMQRRSASCWRWGGAGALQPAAGDRLTARPGGGPRKKPARRRAGRVDSRKDRSIELLGRQNVVRIPQSDHHRPPATITAGRLAWHPTIPVCVDDCRAHAENNNAKQWMHCMACMLSSNFRAAMACIGNYPPPGHTWGAPPM
ncbi:protein of unknown function (plasmid) [Ralstonia solanacearum PSI07]|nr:protein of unknown function [Ralstonia solanacearum PSI07]